ncbi:LOW QUALITY PROTEIN: hypothetical protein PHMEG_00026403 [Phytophthora megakarya]|uniref:Chromo domain-containing protein n=1 Tax=Phytophthora megakarya TaxID=4795 RepID=A0A225VAH3_9STRA|nr:LOW QUALITY PROTEIN: hypothetical protein PHMEG_00026403 [Phytophthora megakarya]
MSDRTRSRLDLASDRVKEGYARKLAHLWHGPFRVTEKINEFSIKLEIAGTGYQIFPVVHVSKLKLVKDFPDRTRIARFHISEPTNKKSNGSRIGKETRFGRIYRKFQVYWVGYDDPTWVDEADLYCEAIRDAFLRERANRNRFNVIQSHEEMCGGRGEIV